MIKRISFIVFSFFLIALFANFIHHRELAVAASQTSTITSTTVTIRGGNLNDAYDTSGKPILKPEHGGIIINSSHNGRTAELPVGTKIVLYFPTGEPEISINPQKGIVEAAKGTYDLPKGEIGVLEVVGQGAATITVTKRFSSNKGKLSIGTTNISQNWSGYEHNGTSGQYTDITSNWTIPTASCGTATNTAAEPWIGIDGSNNGYIIQAGTDSNCDANGNANYDTWWNVINDPQNPPPNTVSCTTNINAGDSMFAEVKQVSGSTWAITIKDLTQSLDCSPSNQTYNGPYSSAEWIVERPANGYVNGHYTFWTLTNYNSAPFTNGTQNGANPNLNYSTDSAEMTSDGTQNGEVLSTPSTPNSTTNGFTAYYCDPSTGCSTAWNNVSPSGMTNGSLYGMAAISATSAWATGYEQVPGYNKKPVAYFNNGSGWTKYYPNNPNSNNHSLLHSIAGSSSDAWTVGEEQAGPTKTLAYHWTGSSWGNRVTSDNPGGTTIIGHNNILYSVAYAGTDVFAVGYYYNGSHNLPLIEKWTGTKFATQSASLPGSATDANLYGVAFSSATDGWAVGSAQWYVGSTRYAYDVYYHYDGTNWTPTLGSVNTGVLYGVTVLPSGEAWATGSQGTSNTPLIMHYTNGNWTQDTRFNGSYPTGTHLLSVSADSSSDVWIVGYATGPYTMHYNGASWSQVSTPSVSGSTQLQGVAVNSGVAWAGGFNIPSGYNPYPIMFMSL